MVEDAPITVNVDGKPWSPRNYEDRYEGRVSVRRALEQSLNGATVRIAQVVGAPAIAETAKAFGLVQKAAPMPSLALGALEVTPIDLARRVHARSRAAGCDPGAIRSVRAVYRPTAARRPPPSDAAPSAVITPAEAYLMTSLLQGVIRSGTGSAVPVARAPAARSRARRARPTRGATRGSSATRRVSSPRCGSASTMARPTV